VTSWPSPPLSPPEGAGATPSRRWTYLTVILVQVVTLLGLWVFQSYFGS
jgi:hypothetical protein